LGNSASSRADIEEKGTAAHSRRLLVRREVAETLQLAQEDVDWLVRTSQLKPIHICGQERFDSQDVHQLIESYKIIQARRKS